MTKYFSFPLALLCSLVFSCTTNDPTPAVDPNTPARTAQEAKARLVAQSKWTIDEALVNGKLAYKRGQTSAKPADIIELDWCRFNSNGTFEVKSTNDPTIDKLFYKLDEANSQIVIGYDDQFKDAEDWTIKAGSVYSSAFDMELKDGTELIYFKMVAVP